MSDRNRAVRKPLFATTSFSSLRLFQYGLCRRNLLWGVEEPQG